MNIIVLEITVAIVTKEKQTRKSEKKRKTQKKVWNVQLKKEKMTAKLWSVVFVPLFCMTLL